MGYLSQKKRKIRANLFFNAAAGIMSALAVVLLINPEFVFFKLNLFHFYCLSWVLFLGAVIGKKLAPSLVLGGVLVIMYVLLAISGNIFLSDRIKDGTQREIVFDKNGDNINDAYAKGVLVSVGESFAAYAFVNEEEPLLLIRVDLKEVSANKYPVLLKNLHKFIMQQDTAVIVFGDFGMPEWARAFRKFVDYSGLSVKNRLVFTGWFEVPHFYILGFNNTGVEKIGVSDGKISAVISYDIS